jgi:hypothetical protein
MPLGRTHKEIERLLRGKAISTKLARAIVRKSGVKPATVTSGEVAFAPIPTPILDIPGTTIDPDTGEPVPNPPYPGTSIACSLELQQLIEAFKEEQGG